MGCPYNGPRESLGCRVGKRGRGGTRPGGRGGGGEEDFCSHGGSTICEEVGCKTVRGRVWGAGCKRGNTWRGWAVPRSEKERLGGRGQGGSRMEGVSPFSLGE